MNKSSVDRPIRVVHVISGLERGGAEVMLYRLLRSRDRERFNHHVISLSDEGSLGPAIEALDVPVQHIGIERRRIYPTHITRLVRLLSDANADIVQTWMYHADLLAGLMAKVGSRSSVIWGIHHTKLDQKVDARSTILVAQLCSRLSSWVPRAIVCCSKATVSAHTDMGYRMDQMIVIPNGFDLDEFHPIPNARDSVRRELLIPDDAILIGMAARFHPQKDHQSFIKAAGEFRKLIPNAYFLLCGSGIEWDNSVLREWINDEGIESSFRLLGNREDMPRIYSALDIASLSSRSEAFPNVVGEAMACSVPCVVSDVGDSAEIVGDTGIVVRPRDYKALARGWQELARMGERERRILGQRARERIRDRYELSAITKRYEDLYIQIAVNRK